MTKILNRFPILIIFILILIIILTPYVYNTYQAKKYTQSIHKKALTNYFEPPSNLNDSYTAPEWISLEPYSKITNKDGLYDSINYSIKKNPGVRRIIVLGDSYTDGAFMSTIHTWPELLEKNLNSNKDKLCENMKSYEVINLAVASYDLQYSIERFKRKGVKYDPDIVLWFAHHEDIWQVNELLQPLIKKYGKLHIKSTEDNPYPVWSNAYDELHSHYSNSDILTIQKTILSTFPEDFLDSLRIITFNNLEPYDLEVLDSLKPSIPKITDIEKDRSLSFSDGHPNTHGHEVIATDVYKILSGNKSLLCN